MRMVGVETDANCAVRHGMIDTSSPGLQLNHF
jgi:hypothetical protein